MKKIIFILMLVMCTIGFTEKLTTDGEDHLDKITGSFGIRRNIGFKIAKKGNKLEFIADNVVNGPIFKINKYLYLAKLTIDTGEGLEKEDYCFAYDTKHRKFVNVNCKNLNIIQILDKIGK